MRRSSSPLSRSRVRLTGVPIQIPSETPKVCSMMRSNTVAAAAPVDSVHAQAGGNRRRGELDPVLTGEIAVDEDDGDAASTPFPPAQLDLTRLQSWHGLVPICSGPPWAPRLPAL